MDNGNFTSKLDAIPERFLAEALENALVGGRRTPQDFIRHFPPDEIMSALDSQPRLRSIFLTVLVGLREKTALRTPSQDAGRLLQAALEEQDIDPDALLRTFEPDDRVRYLSSQKIWAFLLEGEFWKVSRSKDSAGHKTAQAHIAYLLDRGIAHGLISHADVIEGISVEVLGEKLPRAELTKIIRQALDVGRRGAPFKHAEIFAATPASILVDHIALPQIYEGIILPLFGTAGYVAASSSRLEDTRVDERRLDEPMLAPVAPTDPPSDPAKWPDAE